MILTIKENKIDDKKSFLVNFVKENLIISEDSNDWSNEGINMFLIKLASATPDGDMITIEYDDENKDPIFKHIILLFSEFATEYNKSVDQSNEIN